MTGEHQRICPVPDKQSALMLSEQTSLIQTQTDSIHVKTLENSVNCSMSMLVKGLPSHHNVWVVFVLSQNDSVLSHSVRNVLPNESQSSVSPGCLLVSIAGRTLGGISASSPLAATTSVPLLPTPDLASSDIAPASCRLLQITGSRDSMATPSLDTAEPETPVEGSISPALTTRDSASVTASSFSEIQLFRAGPRYGLRRSA